jgi:hypothetical protein
VGFLGCFSCCGVFVISYYLSYVLVLFSSSWFAATSAPCCYGFNTIFVFSVWSHLLTYRAEPFLRSRQLCNPSRTSEGSIPCSQEPSTGPYPQPYQSHPISLRSVIILSTHLRLGLHSGFFPSGFPINILYTFVSLIRATCTAHLILLDLIILIILGEEYKL